jgi:hypothetical protein
MVSLVRVVVEAMVCPITGRDRTGGVGVPIWDTTLPVTPRPSLKIATGAGVRESCRPAARDHQSLGQ